MAPVSSGTNCPGILSRQQKGIRGEHQARRYLEQAGLIFVGANVRRRTGEIDLIMQDGSCWVFVEVRYRDNERYGGPLASITPWKQQKLLKTAAVWLAEHRASFDTVDCRFDIIAITGNQLEWLANAFNTQI